MRKLMRCTMLWLLLLSLAGCDVFDLSDFEFPTRPVTPTATRPTQPALATHVPTQTPVFTATPIQSIKAPNLTPTPTATASATPSPLPLE